MTLARKINRAKRYVRAVYVRKFIHLTRRIKVPGFQGVSLWETIFFFLYSLRKGLIGMRAGAVAFHFFLALIPFGLVLVILTGYTPGIDIEGDIAPVLSTLIPDQLTATFMESIHEYERSSVTSWISVGFVLALYFTSNGFTVLIKAFNSSSALFAKRNKWWSVKLLSLGYVIVALAGIILTFYMLIYVRIFFVNWAESSEFVKDYFNQIYGLTDFIFLGFLIYFAISLMYYFGPRIKERKFHFFSPGATLAFILILMISIIYQLYVTSYANYNQLYGSLGTVIMLLIWIYMMSFALLIGFELNASIHSVLEQKKLNTLGDLEKRYDKKDSLLDN